MLSCFQAKNGNLIISATTEEDQKILNTTNTSFSTLKSVFMPYDTFVVDTSENTDEVDGMASIEESDIYNEAILSYIQNETGDLTISARTAGAQKILDVVTVLFNILKTVFVTNDTDVSNSNVTITPTGSKISNRGERHF